ncbi:PREDICTED: NAC domain-containing protein 43-like [Nelumbo nucifera]|uniref:NAC domain-containing protein 43-like n=2 Tax=Nelumbo nucifera TaxID=4432 RepID=A0A1U7ZSW9_NELNU|nr:PREDICTED: NAC domain-containing protein 43-like [Nelumbo nucifera]DAD36154.1 TPA_asm: hypothetical protein HUJ06_006794 [Nelumbo nucifera]
MPGEEMSVSVNGQSRVPPGFRFHPTEEELLHYYLRKKVAYEKIDLDVIRDVDLNKLEPWDIQEKCRIGSTPQNDWYFFSHKDKKYPTGTRTNRATAAGFWKATGRDKVIYSSFRRIGMRKTLVFYKGRAPHGQKSDWIMHEYRLDDHTIDTNASGLMGETTQEEGWVVCRVFKKKNHHKCLDSPKNSSVTVEENTQILKTSNDGSLDQILQYMGRSCKQETETNNNIRINTSSSRNNNIRIKPIQVSVNNGLHERSQQQLPALESPILPFLGKDSTRLDQIQACTSQAGCYQPIDVQDLPLITQSEPSVTNQGFSGWAALDRLVASQLNGQSETCKQLSCFDNDSNMAFCSPPDHELQLPQLRGSIHRSSSYHTSQDYNNEIDLWSFTRSCSSSSDPLCHVSNSST